MIILFNKSTLVIKLINLFSKTHDLIKMIFLFSKTYDFTKTHMRWYALSRCCLSMWHCAAYMQESMVLHSCGLGASPGWGPVRVGAHMGPKGPLWAQKIRFGFKRSLNLMKIIAPLPKFATKSCEC